MLDYLFRNRLRIFILSTFIFFFFILLSQTEQQQKNNWFIKLTHSIAFPVQYLSNYLTDFCTNYIKEYVFLQNTYKDNQRLLNEINQLKKENARFYEMAYSYQRLLKALKFDEYNQDQKIIAQVIARAEEGYSKILVIDKGSRDGIRKNFAVMTADGIVGKIKSVSPLQSIVQTINDIRSQFPVLIQRTRNNVILQGSANGELLVTQIPYHLKLQIDDRIVTSGLVGIFPKGELIGKIVEINKKSFGLFQEAIIQPAVDISKVEELFIILKSENNIHPTLFMDKNSEN